MLHASHQATQCSGLDVSPCRIEERRELLKAGTGLSFGELCFQYSPEIFDLIEVRLVHWSCAFVPEALHVLLVRLLGFPGRARRCTDLLEYWQ